jgi:hypothetical protein
MSMILPDLPDGAPLPAVNSLMVAVANRCEDRDWVIEMTQEGDRLMEEGRN